MALQPFNDANEIAAELTADVDIASYLITKYKSSDKTKVQLAGAGDVPLAVRWSSWRLHDE